MASTELDLRRQARAAHQAQKKASQEKHARIATQMALGDEKAYALRDDALRMVARWQERALCSPVYIDRWRTMLDAPPQDIAKNLMEMDPQWATALHQNTPFAVDIP